MAYVLEVISKDGKIKYINSAKATVYCPEYAARYDDKKTAMTVAAAPVSYTHLTLPTIA